MISRSETATKLLIGAGLAAAFALTLASGASAQRRFGRDLPITAAPQVTQKTFTLGAAPLVAVDNVTGPITVVGDGGGAVRFTATETIAARSQDALAQAQRDVHLDVTQTGDSLKLYVDGPFRCGGHDATTRCDHWGRHWNNPGYEVRFDFELHVPAAAKLDLRTVNGGDVAARDVSGDYQVHNVNGGVNLAGLAGSGEASTVNGSVSAAFRANPRAASTFSSVNGKISLYLQSGLNADLSYHTVNGSVYSDFPVAPQPVAGAASEREGHMIVFRRGRTSSARVGNGGPALSLRTVNGSIYLHQVK